MYRGSRKSKYFELTENNFKIKYITIKKFNIFIKNNNFIYKIFS